MTDEEIEMHVAASAGDAYELGYLLASRVDVNVVDERGNTALHEAATPEVVSLLLKYGAKVNTTNSYGMTPLHSNIENDNAGGVKLLLDAKASTTVRNAAGLPALHFAVAERAVECAEAIIRYEPDTLIYTDLSKRNVIRFAKDEELIDMIDEIWAINHLIIKEKRALQAVAAQQASTDLTPRIYSISKRQKTSGATLMQ